MAESQEPNPSAPAGRSDRLVKIGFLVVALVVAYVVYQMVQTRSSVLPDWPTNINDALSRAKQTHHEVLAVFIGDPLNNDGLTLLKTLAKRENRQVVEKGKFVRVKVVVKDVKDVMAVKYKVTVLPTVLVLDPNAQEIARKQGTIGETQFYGFINGVNKKAQGK